MTTDEALTEIADSGWLLNYLRQHTADKWEAHLRNPNITAEERALGYIYTVSFASGTSAAEALTNALTTGEHKLTRPDTTGVIYDLRQDKPVSILSALGLTQPHIPINRRF